MSSHKEFEQDLSTSLLEVEEARAVYGVDYQEVVQNYLFDNEVEGLVGTSDDAYWGINDG